MWRFFAALVVSVVSLMCASSGAANEPASPGVTGQLLSLEREERPIGLIIPKLPKLPNRPDWPDWPNSPSWTDPIGPTWPPFDDTMPWKKPSPIIA